MPMYCWRDVFAKLRVAFFSEKKRKKKLIKTPIYSNKVLMCSFKYINSCHVSQTLYFQNIFRGPDLGAIRVGYSSTDITSDAVLTM